jgi:universal stress protein A
MKGLEYAKALASEFKAKLILLHSVALQYHVASDEYARYDLPLLLEQTEKVAKQQMRDLVQQTNWNGIELETSIQIGHAGQQTCAEATDCKADLIAISTHGRTGFEHVLLGSIAEYVVRHASCPVLVVPSRERALPKSAVARK